MNEELLIRKFINALSEIDDANCISSKDFTDEREANMILVGVESTEQMNIGLPDFRSIISIVIDCFIEDDKEGKVFDYIKNEVKRILNEYIMRHRELNDMFEDIPVVGFFFDGESQELTESSNRATLRYQVISSY